MSSPNRERATKVIRNWLDEFGNVEQEGAQIMRITEEQLRFLDGLTEAEKDMLRKYPHSDGGWMLYTPTNKRKVKDGLRILSAAAFVCIITTHLIGPTDGAVVGATTIGLGAYAIQAATHKGQR